MAVDRHNIEKWIIYKLFIEVLSEKYSLYFTFQN